MMIAASEGHKEIVSLLIERGGNMDLQDKVRLYHPSLLISPNYYIIFTSMVGQL